MCKEIIMEDTFPLMFKIEPDGSFIAPLGFEGKTTEDGINYLIKETDEKT